MTKRFGAARVGGHLVGDVVQCHNDKATLDGPVLGGPVHVHGHRQDNIGWENIHYWECAPTDVDCGHRDWDYNFPVPKGYDREDVINPKDVVSEAHGKLVDLSPQLDRVTIQLHDGSFRGVDDDVVDALTLPIFMVADAVENMDKIADIADEIEEEKRKAIILAFLSAILRP